MAEKMLSELKVLAQAAVKPFRLSAILTDVDE